MIVASGIAMQFGAKPLFENVSVKFGGGNRDGLIGANGCGKSTFMKILGGELEPSAGTVAIDANERVGRLRQDQFAHEGERVLDVVLQGHAEMWAAMPARRDYATGGGGGGFLKRGSGQIPEYGGYTSRRGRGSCCSAWGWRRAARGDERGGAGLEAARAARAGALRRSGHPAAR